VAITNKIEELYEKLRFEDLEIIQFQGGLKIDDKSSDVILSMFSVIFNRFYKQNGAVFEQLPMILGHL